MAAVYCQPPSRLAGLDDFYEAYCLDEAILDYTARLRAGQKLRPPKATDNRGLIKAMKEGASHGGRRSCRGQP
jgi:hypothetical protein